MTWSIAGLVNPTVVVPRGARVTVHVFNADGDTLHGWELTTTPPPYADKAMMDIALARPDAFAMPMSHATAQRWLGRTVRFTVAHAGTYYYLCPVMSHAHQGMYGRLMVSLTRSARRTRRQKLYSTRDPHSAAGRHAVVAQRGPREGEQ